MTCSGSIWAEFVLLIISYSDLSASLEEAGITKVKLYSTYDSAQGKVLQDAITKLNGDLSIEAYEVSNWGCEIIKANYVRKYGKVVHVYFNFTVKADHVAPYTSLFSLPCKPISMAEVLPPFFRHIDGTQIPTRYLSDYGVIQSTYTLDVSSDYVFEWVFICE